MTGWHDAVVNVGSKGTGQQDPKTAALEAAETSVGNIGRVLNESESTYINYAEAPAGVWIRQLLKGRSVVL